MKILLKQKRAYPWHTDNGISVCGYLQLKTDSNTVYKDSSAVSYFSQASCFEEFLSLLKSVDGVFSVVIVRGSVVWAAVDRARSMPIYYAVDGSALSDDSKCLREFLQLDKNHTDSLRMAELMTAGAVSDRYTTYAEIHQITIASAAQLQNGQIHTAPYYDHIAPITEYSRDEAKVLLRRTAEDTIDNILKVVGSRPIALSLSGGYDSRFLACMLKERGAEKVYCYTYGVKGSFEVTQSKKVADALGYDWVCVTYTENDVVSQLDQDGQAYIDACYQHDFSTYLQNYIAVKQLHNQGYFPPDAVFITGLCHDMPTGAYIKHPEETPYPITADGVAAYIMDGRFDRYRLKKEAAQVYLEDLRRQIHQIGLEITSFQNFVQICDVLETGFNHSRRFLAMNHSHEYFGYEWLLPCWNQQLLDFWYSLPYTFRIQQNLYEEWLMEDLCKKYGLDTKKTINRYTRSKFVNGIIRQVGGLIAYCCFKTHKTLRLRTDINGGAVLRQQLYDGISQKKAIKYSRASQALLLSLYLMEQRYGHHFWCNIRKILKK